MSEANTASRMGKYPRYAVVCFIEGGESGGHVAGPICAQLLKWILERNPVSE